jgi:hypothetical protein
MPLLAYIILEKLHGFFATKCSEFTILAHALCQGLLNCLSGSRCCDYFCRHLEEIRIKIFVAENMQVDGRLEVEIALSDREKKLGSDKILRRSTDTSDEILGACFFTKECHASISYFHKTADLPSSIASTRIASQLRIALLEFAGFLSKKARIHLL